MCNILLLLIIPQTLQDLEHVLSLTVNICQETENAPDR